MIVLSAIVAAAAALLAAIVAMLIRSERTDVNVDQAHVDEDRQPEEFIVLHAEPFTSEAVDELGDVDGDVYAPAAPPTGGRHHHDTVEFVARDYLIPEAYESLYAPRIRDARQATQG